ncbi:putative phage abortive infection protein [Vogesella oryzae]|uniref:putative phage abortive infection protein n=1 Tax=Vogesella oryzae TaxID=1735285 RepID=UPI00158204F0|nr:putative phage abortive infection protein [Vogesella oryzae]
MGFLKRVFFGYWVIFAFAFVLLVWVWFLGYGGDWIASVLYRALPVESGSVEASAAIAVRGQSGDMFGSFNAFFAALSTLLIVLTLYFQRSKDEKSKFEAHFFQLLSVHRDIVSSTHYFKDKKVTVAGKPAFYHIYRHFRSLYEKILGDHADGGAKKINDTRGICVESATLLTKKFSSELQHYFRNMYYVVDFVDKSTSLSGVDKRFYTSLFRAQLSSYELVLLFYNGLTGVGAEKFKPLIEKYSLLRNIDEDLLMDLNHKNYYDESAFWGEGKAKAAGLLGS